VDNIAQAAVKYLAGQASVLAQLGTFPVGDPAAGQAYLFQTELKVTLEGTSAAALVLTPAGSMAAPTLLGTARFQRLSVEIYVDPVRDANRNVVEDAALTGVRGDQVFSVVHARLQRTDPDTQEWGDMITSTCTLLLEGDFAAVSDGNMMLRKQSFYGLTVNGWTDIIP
jgi:hypothetical protein